MTRQDERRPVLEAEVKRWSAMSTKQLLAELKDAQAYPVEVESKQYTDGASGEHGTVYPRGAAVDDRAASRHLSLH